MITLEGVLKAFDDAPLPQEVREEAVVVLRRDEKYLRKAIDDMRYRAPQVNAPGNVMAYMMKRITHLLERHDIPQPNGRDTSRLLYEALGGENRPLGYEILTERN